MPDISDLLASPDMKVTGRRVKVSFPNGRSHRISLAEKADSWEFRGVVLSPDSVSDQYGEDEFDRLGLALRAWQRNSTARLCGFRLDADGALVGEATVPKIGLTGEELTEMVRAVARACDLLEAHLTGGDSE